MGDCQCFIVSLYLSLTHTHIHTLKVLRDVQPEKMQPSGKQILFNYTTGTWEQTPPQTQGQKHNTHSHTHTHTHIACIHTAYIVYTLECSEAWGQCYVQWWVFCSYGGGKKKADETHSLWNICAKICSTKCRWWKHWWTTTATQTIMKTHTPNMHKI